MKAEAGWGTAALIVAAAVGIGSQAGKGRTPADGATEMATHAMSRQAASVEKKTDFERGPCVDLEDAIRTYLLAPSDKIAAPYSCYGTDSNNRDYLADQQASITLQQRANGLQYVVAIVPDPVHTHFSLAFDREAEAIQQGVQDEGYFYDSSWLPWETEDKSLVLLSDQDKAEDERKAREAQPGIILFRRKQDQGESPDKSLTIAPYEQGLAVFVVGEDPTAGVHKQQFENAVSWIAALRHPGAEANTPPLAPVKILGPMFSGSLPSLAQLLSDDAQGITKLDASRRLSIYSGSVTSNALVSWFASPQRGMGPVHFYSFQHSDDINLGLYRDYLIGQGFEIGRLAIISEDETAYGGFSKEDPGSLCKPRPPHQGFPGEGEIGPACLYYPRDISALRDAYQKQGIFSSPATQQAADAARRTLTSNLADPRSKVQDTIRSYSGDLTALSQEAVLLQLVSMLRAHESQYVVLRSSNPLDQLFLSQFLRLEYPEGRIVIEGSDLLLRRETGAATLSGIMTLNTYPLLPWEYDWTAPRGAPPYLHSHRVFAQDLSEGTYVATRFMVHAPNCLAALDQVGIPQAIFLPHPCSGLEIPDYGPPFWMISKTETERKSFEEGGAAHRPATWLSVLGRDGFWPVAAMTDNKFSEVEPGEASGPIESVFNMALAVVGVRSSTEEVDGRPPWLPMPLSMKMYLFALLLWSSFHLYCCARPSLTKPSYRAHFVRVAGKSHRLLIFFGSTTLAFVPILLAWGYGAMSLKGEPVANGWFYRAPLLLVWVMSGLAIVANMNDDLKHGTTAGDTKGKWRARWRALSRWTRVRVFLAAYLLTTLVFYCIVFSSLDHALNKSNRVFTYFRSIHLTTGVSPLLPLIALSGGLYLWFWYSLQGLALFGKGRPRLPPNDSLGIEWVDKTRHSFLSMVSAEAGRKVEELCGPLSAETLIMTAVFFIVLYAAGLAIGDGHVPIRSLGSIDYSHFYYVAVDLCVSLMLANAWQLMRIWRRLRQMLVFLDRIPLRRTMEGLKGYSWGSVWKMGGNVLDVRNKLFYREFESLTHISNTLSPRNDVPGMAEIRATQAARADYADWYNRTWDDPRARDLSKLELCQRSVACTAGVLFAKVLVPHWRTETESLVQEESGKKSMVIEVAENKALLCEVSEKEEGDTGKKNSDEVAAPIRNAEEFVCMVYLGFIQNILGRMRTLASGLLWVYVAVTVSIATYPFDPRPLLSGAMILTFLILGVVIATVYSQMHRDATLSHVTNTKPGELGLEFWFKLVAFGAGPLLGLLATIFPELTGSLFSWLQPGLESIK